MQRRHFNTGLALVLGLAAARATGQKMLGEAETGPDGDGAWAAIESAVGGRLGVAMLCTGSGKLAGHRLDERFPMCSTFKWLLAARVLQRVADGQERLDRRLVYAGRKLPEWAPVSGKHADANGLTIGELCQAAIALSDNGAANLLLETVGGPQAVTAQARAFGDGQTRLDRDEPELNVVPPGDARDTTTPRAMAGALRAGLLGDGLPPAQRAQLVAWMSGTQTGLKRLRAGVPADWRVADKTGTWDKATLNDVAVFWPPDRPPIVVAAYLTDCPPRPGVDRERALADVGREVARRVHAAPPPGKAS
ncbi:MAG: class A beta-lactamase [Burkholderiaceae bacterium]